MELLKEKKKEIICILVVLLIAIASITSNSLWFDESCRVLDAIEGNYSQMFKQSMEFAQPGYMSFMSIWIKLFGSTEVILRLSNILFALLAVIYAMKIVKAKGWNIWYSLLFFIHPMFVYYMNEVTPYIVVYALSLMFIYYVFEVENFSSIKNVIEINLIFLLGVIFHFMFGFIYVAYIFKVVYMFLKEKDKLVLKNHIVVLLIFLLIYLPLLLCYAKSLGVGTGGSTRTGFGVKNIMYIVYGFLGMSGLGLSRNDLRAGNFNQLTTSNVLLLGLAVLTYIVFFIFFIKYIKEIWPKINEYFFALISFFAIIFSVSFVIHFGVWERHCFTIFPLYMICFISIIDEIIKSQICNNFYKKMLLSLYLMVMIVSMLNIRFNYAYCCDDYKGIYNHILENYLNNNEEIKVYIKNIDFTERYYGFDKLKEKVGVEIIEYNSNDFDKIYDKFKKDNNSVLIMFEKNIKRDIYNKNFEDDIKVNEDFNSFKILEH